MSYRRDSDRLAGAGIFAVLLVISIIATLALGIFGGYQHFALNRDLDSYINRAQVAADAEDMHEYTVLIQQNMERLGVTSGHTALIFKKADNDMALHYRAIQRINERLTEVQVLPKNETAYQVALDDIRGTLRELPNPADGLAWVRYWWWIGLVLTIFWGLTFVAFLKV